MELELRNRRSSSIYSYELHLIVTLQAISGPELRGRTYSSPFPSFRSSNPLVIRVYKVYDLVVLIKVYNIDHINLRYYTKSVSNLVLKI